MADAAHRSTCRGCARRWRNVEARSSAPGFWDDADQAEETLRVLNDRRASLEQAAGWAVALEDARAAIELAEAEADADAEESLLPEALAALEALGGELEMGAARAARRRARRVRRRPHRPRRLGRRRRAGLGGDAAADVHAVGRAAAGARATRPSGPTARRRGSSRRR